MKAGALCHRAAGGCACGVAGVLSRVDTGLGEHRLDPPRESISADRSKWLCIAKEEFTIC